MHNRRIQELYRIVGEGAVDPFTWLPLPTHGAI
jgi:hypothetical protein